MKTAVEVHSTDQIIPHHRVEYWNERASTAITRLKVEPPKHSTFNSTLKHVRLGRISLMEATSTPTRVMHLAHPIFENEEPSYLFHLQRSGRTLNQQLSKESILEPGDFTLCDSAQPCNLVLEGENSMLVLRVPHSILKRSIPAPEALINVHMTSRDGVNSLVTGFINTFWQQCQIGLEEPSGQKLAENICDMLATCYAEKRQTRPEATTTQMVMRYRIEQEINSRLWDASLSPAAIANKVNISTRYLHKLFSDDTETVSRFILRRRLEQCAKALADMRQSPKTISTIAFEWGFNNTTYFARVFKKHYDISPSEFRQRQFA